MGVLMTKKFIPLSVPNFKGNELNYVTKAVNDEWVSTAGQYIKDFEEKLAEYLKVDFSVAVQSGTSAIHLSLIEAGVGPGDEVIAPTLTFIAAVNPIKYCGASPIFIDCDNSLCLDPIKLEHFLNEECEIINDVTINKNTGKKIKAIIVVHVFGNCCDMESIMKIAERYNLIVIEDATEALGSKFIDGKYEGKFAGTIGHFGCYSFNGNKIITTGGGGAVVSNNEKRLNHIKYLSTQAKNDTTNFIHDEIGYNYRMTNLQAALGIAQLECLEKFIKIKEENYHYYKKLFEDDSRFKILKFNDNIRSNKWFYSLYIMSDVDIRKIVNHLIEHNIQSRPIWGLIHEQKPYVNCESYKIEKSIDYVKHVINLPCSTNLSKDDIETVVECIKKIDFL